MKVCANFTFTRNECSLSGFTGLKHINIQVTVKIGNGLQ
jgi:hypothetical protein